MRLGLAIPHYDTSLGGEPASWEGIRAAAVAAEATGFDSIWVSDHLFLDWGKYGGPEDRQGSFECWTTLAALAAVTEKVRLGSLTLCNDFRNPALLAKMIATLDLLSDGRVDAGLGAGWYEPEYAAAGIDFDRPAVRIRRAGEAAEIVRRLLQGEELTFEGRYYSLDGAICRPLPVQAPTPPIWMGGKGDLLLKTVARHADGWNFSWIGSFEAYEERLQAAFRACEEEDRDPQTLKRSVGVYLLAGSDDADVKRRFERVVERTPNGVLPGTREGSAVSWDEFRTSRVAGTVSEVTDQLGRLADLGVEEAILTLGVLPFQLVDLEDVELVGSAIAPAIR
jgi:probable F420-dependent oxidoreductase